MWILKSEYYIILRLFCLLQLLHPHFVYVSPVALYAVQMLSHAAFLIASVCICQLLGTFL